MCRHRGCLTFFYQGIVTDRLGSEGIVSVIGFAIDLPKNCIYLNEYILSCRVFDRYIEEAMLIPIFQYALDQNYKIKINLKKGTRNKKVQNFIIQKIPKSNELTLSEINKFLQEFRKLPIEVKLENIL